MAATSPESPMLDFGFAFDDVNFSDRVLSIKILSDFVGLEPGTNDFIGDLGLTQKRGCDDASCSFSVDDQIEENDEPILGRNKIQDLEEGGNLESAVLMIEESLVNQPCDEADSENDPSCSMEYSGVLRVRNVNISSPILAARSPFFHKLFSNGMKESQQRHVTIQITASEEDALLDLLKYMYSNKLPRAATPKALLNVLIAADKFEVASCMKYCTQLLLSLPMTVESALLFLDIPSVVATHLVDIVQQLADSAKQFLANSFKDLSKCEEEFLKLPLAGVEAVLSSDDLQVFSEDDVYDFAVKWAQSHYPEPEERRDVMRKHLLQLIRFQFLTYHKLKQLLTSGETDCELVSKLFVNALLFNAASLYGDDSGEVNSLNVERWYKCRPVKVVTFVAPLKQCIVYWDLKREECTRLLPKGYTHSWKFYLGGRAFCVMVIGFMQQTTSFISFKLVLDMSDKALKAIKVDYEFAVRMLPSKEFVSKLKLKDVLFGRNGEKVGAISDMLTVPMSAFTADDSLYFINGLLHLRLELTLKD